MSLNLAAATAEPVMARQAVEQLPAFAAIEHDDRRGALWIAAILSLIFVGMTFGTRMYVRKHMLGRDDFAGIAAVTLAVTQYASLFAGMPSGLGTSKTSVTQGNERKNASVCFDGSYFSTNLLLIYRPLASSYITGRLRLRPLHGQVCSATGH